MSISNAANLTGAIKAASSGKRLLVLGGGLSGLSYLHYLRNFLTHFKKTSAISSMTLLEANDYMGGSVKSHIYEDNVIHELGPRSIRVQGVRAHNTITLLEELKLGDKLLHIHDSSPSATNRYIYDNNQFYLLQFKLTRLFSKLPNCKTTIAKALYNELSKEKMRVDDYPYRDPPLYDFIAYRFGPDVAEKVLDPVMRGITAGDCRQLSTRSTMGSMIDQEQAYGSIIKGMNKPVGMTPHDDLFPNEILNSKLLDKIQREKIIGYNISTGLQTIPEHLSNSLLNTNEDGLLSIYNQSKVESIEFNDPADPDRAPCTAKVRTLDGDLIEIDADHVVSCITAKDLAKILPKSLPDYYTHSLEGEKEDIFKYIHEIDHVPVGCVCVEYRNLDIKSQPHMNSFGFLTNSKAGRKILGISYDSVSFPSIDEGHNSFRMTCMMGGSWYKEVFGTENVDNITDAQMEQIALDEIREILKIKQEPHRMSSYLWKTGIAQYRPGHINRLRETRQLIGKSLIPLTLLGQSYDGYAINDVIFSARMAANEFVKNL